MPIGRRLIDHHLAHEFGLRKEIAVDYLIFSRIPEENSASYPRLFGGRMLKKLKAIIFDFDGTLVDSYRAITASINHVRAAHNLSPLSEPEVRRCVGRGP